MKSFNKIIKVSGLIFLIILASVGVGIGGGVPITSSKKEHLIEIKTEAKESNEEITNLYHFDKK